MLTPEALGSQSCGDSGGPGRGGQRCTAACAGPRRLTALSRPPCRHVSRFRSRPGPSPLRFSPAAVRPSPGLPCAVAGNPSVSSAGSDARLSGPRPHRQGTGRARGSCPPVTPPAFAPANLPLPPLLPLCLLQAASVALCPEPGAPLCDGPRCTPGVTERPPALAWRPALGPTSACPGLLARGLLQHRAGLASNLVLFSSGISDGTFR